MQASILSFVSNKHSATTTTTTTEEKEKPLVFVSEHLIKEWPQFRCRLIVIPDFVSRELAAELWDIYTALPASAWKHPSVFGRVTERKVLAHGTTKHFGNICVPASPYPQAVSDLEYRLSLFVPEYLQRMGFGVVLGSFNSCLVNHYPHARVGIAAHADKEAENIPGAPIACISLGTTRTFMVSPQKHNLDKCKSYSVELPPRSLMLMVGDFQKHLNHSIPPQLTTGTHKERISLTFRMTC